MPAAASARAMILSTTRISACPVTTGTFSASQAAAPRPSRSGSRARGRAAQPHLLGLRRAGTLAQLRERDVHRHMSVRARPVRHHLRADEQLTARCSASWNRCPRCGCLRTRLSSRAPPDGLDRGGAFRGEVPADHAGAPNVVPTCTYRLSNPSSSPWGREARHFCSATAAMIRRSSREAPAWRPQPGS